MKPFNLIAAASLLGEALASALPSIPIVPPAAPAAIEQLLKNRIVADPDSGPLSRMAAPALVETDIGGVRYGCKCYVGDRCWPAASKWHRLNSTVDGRLIVNIPPGAPCYQSFDGPLGTILTTNEAACANVRADFTTEQWVADTPAGSMLTYSTNDTCRPEGNLSNTCTLGNYPVYVLLATTKAHVKAGIDFARQNNIRLVIRNTGHDMIGRSTGWGSLVINTHSFQSVEWISNYSGPGGYTGGAVKMGAGVQARALLRLAHERNPPVVVVTGECPTVGITGGFVQGGGHGPWGTLKGFSADNVLAFEAVTTSGQYVTANADQNADLFWALKGGGPSTYAVVLSVTMKTFPDVRSTGAVLYINSTHTDNVDLWWTGVSTLHKWTNHFVDNGLYAYVEVLAGHFLRARPFVAVGQSTAELQAILDPFLAELKEQGVPFDFTIKEFPTFFDLYLDLFEDEQASASSLAGGWLFNHDDVTLRNDDIINAMKTVMSPAPGVSGYMVSHIFNPGHGMPVSNSATHPSWRNASNFVLVSLPVPVGSSPAEKAELQDLLTNTMDEALRSASKSDCTYVHEADPYQKNWQSHFWGSCYPLLKLIRKKWDPSGVLYAISTPGTEGWEVIEGDTRLCERLST